MGTRGDVQPLILLGAAMQERGWDVTISVPDEFRGFVSEIAPSMKCISAGRSLQKEILETELGRKLRTAKGTIGIKAVKEFYTEELLDSWFRPVFEHVRDFQPDTLIMSNSMLLCGAAAIPRLLGSRTRLVVAHLLPMDPTVEFLAPTSGKGFSLPTGLKWVHILNWFLVAQLGVKYLFMPRAQKLIDLYADELGIPSPVVDLKLGSAGALTIYAYSPSLLPKPHDWGDNIHVVGSFCIVEHRGLAKSPGGEVPAIELSASPGTIAAGKASQGPLALIGGEPARATRALEGDDTRDLEEERPGSGQGPQPSGGHALAAAPQRLETSESTGAFSVRGRDGALQSEASVFPIEELGGGALAEDGPAPSGRSAIAPPAPLPFPVPSASLGDASHGRKRMPGGLSADLQAFLDRARADDAPVIYVGLGSMLGAVFEVEMVIQILSDLVAGVSLGGAKGAARGIIHTTLGPNREAVAFAADEVAAGVAASRHKLGGRLARRRVGPAMPWFELTTPVDHGLLFPQVALVVHHGGVGTTHAVLAAGKPSIVVPCVPLTDQRFWGRLLVRRGLSPGPVIAIGKLTPAKLAAAVAVALKNLDLYTQRTERLATQLSHEDGCLRAIQLIEADLAGPRPDPCKLKKRPGARVA